MRLVLSLLMACVMVSVSWADVWSGKMVRIKEEGVKLGRKFGGGILRDGAVLEKAKTYSVKFDDGTYLQLEGGYVFKNETELVAAAMNFPKQFRKERAGDQPMAGVWPAGTAVMLTKPHDQVPFGDWVNGKQVQYSFERKMVFQAVVIQRLDQTVSALTGMKFSSPVSALASVYFVKLDQGDGWVRIDDLTLEGWVHKENLVVLSEATKFWDDVIRAKPTDTHALSKRGVAHFLNSQSDKALADLSEVLRIEPTNYDAWISRGFIRHSKQDHDNAIRDYSSAIKLDPKNSLGFEQRAFSLQAKNQPLKAIEDFSEAIKVNPKSSVALLMRAYAWQQLKEDDKAIADFTELIQLKPDQSTLMNALISRGNALSAKKDYDKAIADFTEVMRIEPKFVPARITRASLWKAKNDYDNALADYTEAIKFNPDNPQAFTGRGTVWMGKKDYDKAIADFTEAIKLNVRPIPSGGVPAIVTAGGDCNSCDGVYSAFANRGECWLEKKDYDKAIADCSEAIKLNPKDVTAFIIRADAYFEKKDYKSSFNDLHRVLSIEPKNAGAHLGRAVMQAKLKNYADAESDFKKAMELNADRYVYEEYAMFLASCPDAKYRDGAKALEFAKKSLELAKKEIDKAGKDLDQEYPWDVLAMAYAETGDFTNAIAEQQKAINQLKNARNKDADKLEEAEARMKLYQAKKPYRDE
ncbi:MAG: tetratricopeptide repeat protein [Fimbriiglobus sp.]